MKDAERMVPELVVLFRSVLVNSSSTGSTDSAGRMGIVLPALLARFCGGAGVGSGAWVPA
jgi:hypothetical protein